MQRTTDRPKEGETEACRNALKTQKKCAPATDRGAQIEDQDSAEQEHNCKALAELAAGFPCSALQLRQIGGRHG